MRLMLSVLRRSSTTTRPCTFAARLRFLSVLESGCIGLGLNLEFEAQASGLVQGFMGDLCSH